MPRTLSGLARSLTLTLALSLSLTLTLTLTLPLTLTLTLTLTLALALTRYVSFSWAHDECAWFTHCRLPLEQKYQGDTYQTLKVRGYLSPTSS